MTKRSYIRQWSAATLRGDPMPSYMESFIKLLANRKVPAMKYY